jgi:RNA polymerase sigma-70 factor (ECF subfamily)
VIESRWIPHIRLVHAMEAARLTMPRHDDRSASRDDASRLERMAAEHMVFVWRVIRRLGLQASEADDGVQEVFVVAAQRIADIEPGKERAFLFGAARRVARGLRRVRRPEPSEHADTWRDEAPGPEEISDRKRARERLDAILEEMDDDLREVFVLYEIEGLTLPEIAEVTGAPLGTVTSRLRRARSVFETKCRRFEMPGFRRGGER